eukprot:15066615-Heterocapsa_arctica.AAC.1
MAAATRRTTSRRIRIYGPGEEALDLQVHGAMVKRTLQHKVFSANDDVRMRATPSRKPPDIITL